MKKGREKGNQRRGKVCYGEGGVGATVFCSPGAPPDPSHLHASLIVVTLTCRNVLPVLCQDRTEVGEKKAEERRGEQLLASSLGTRLGLFGMLAKPYRPPHKKQRAVQNSQ